MSVKKNTVLIGAQWGDEGKGKLADLLAEQHDIVCRYQGGNNAGHTIIVGDQKVVLHLIPSGILWKEKVSVIGHGVVFDPQAFMEEVSLIKKVTPITPENLKISLHATVITSYHKLMDKARESLKGATKIGTTGKGIGPAYEDKIGRRALKLGDLTDLENLKEKLSKQLKEKEVLFKELYHTEYPSVEEEAENLFKLGKEIIPFLTDTFSFLQEASANGKSILYEGAQGVLLDVDYGSYPFVTSSNTSYAGVYSGAGVPEGKVTGVLGIAKAYTTRVGEGPFPTELNDEMGEYLQDKGHEFGATTGRRRKCGWLDLPLLRYAKESSCLTEIAITKIDVLAGAKELKVCYAYSYEGNTLHKAYPGLDLSKVTPLYETLPLIPENFIDEKGNFCQEIKKFITFVEESAGIKVSMVAFGPERSQIKFL